LAKSLKVSTPGGRLSVRILACGLALGLAACAAPPAFAQARPNSAHRAPDSVVVEPNLQLFATMCALHAAGFERDAALTGIPSVRTQLREHLLRQQGPATQTLRAYYRDHELATPAATLSRYISFALVAGPPPKFNYMLRHDELPPDVLAIEGFNEVLANFYGEAQIERLWAQVQPEYEREIGRLRGPVGQLVATSTAYLRELLRPGIPRTFAVYVEPMVGGKTNFRDYGDHYAIVLNAGSEPALDDVRHALFHFLLDPLPIRYPQVVAVQRPLLDFAARAPRLPVEYRDDFRSFFTECLVRAVELRLRRPAPEKLAAAIDEAEADGYVLVRPLNRELVKFEKAEPAMSFYFPDLVRAISVAEESQRLQKAAFAPATSGAEAAAADPKAAEQSEHALWLAEGERQIAAQNAAAATVAFERVLAKYPDQSRALYGLAVAAVLQGEVERARDLFRRLVVNPAQADGRAAAKDPLILAWSHVYLGRIHDVDGDRELAVSEYRAALAIEGAPESARLAAQRGMEKGYEPSMRNREGGQQRP
jgi:hypothetical protein